MSVFQNPAFQNQRVPFVTAVWMIVVPLVIVFFAGAGAGTVFDGFASFLDTLFAIFGGASLIFGVLLLAWVLWRAWSAGVLKKPSVDG